MRVKVHLPVTDQYGNSYEISYDADLKGECLSTVDGFLDIKAVQGMRIDCMPEIRKEQ